MSPALVCDDPDHRLNGLIAERFGMVPRPGGTALNAGDGPVLVVQTATAAPVRIAAATNGGELRSPIMVFEADGRRIWNPQFCRYAGYRQSGLSQSSACASGPSTV